MFLLGVLQYNIDSANSVVLAISYIKSKSFLLSSQSPPVVSIILLYRLVKFYIYHKLKLLCATFGKFDIHYLLMFFQGDGSLPVPLTYD